MRSVFVACRLARIPVLSLALLATGVAGALGVTGCTSKTEECNKLIAILNQENKKVSEGMQGTDGSAFKKMGDDLDASMKAIGAVEVKVPELVKLRDEMKKSYGDFAVAAREAGVSMGSDPRKAMAALKQVSSLHEQNSKLVNDINTFCHAR